ncbi:MAG TPA: enoyl-CoA hydratase-related protein [Candidatus Polarisedimenticolia bacterium]|jgi:enoyl-CoA hydratase|nr:enoyl-CoA hydratase-related protein [Candidatus Polarisedimenticolia bacterium]
MGGSNRVLYESHGGIARLTINRPEKLNALDRQTMAEIDQAVAAAGDDAAVGVLIVTGAGEKAFVAGADIFELASQTPVEGAAYARRGQGVLERLERLGKPSIAAINGYALGGGLELAMACTLRLAAETAKLGQPEVALGIIPGYGGTQRLSRLVGAGRALEMLLSGDPIDAREAHRIGLVNRVVPQAELQAAAEALARTLLLRGPVALRYVLQAVHEGLQMGLAEGSSTEATLFGLCCATEDMREGTRAFMEKRKPSFKGR